MDDLARIFGGKSVWNLDNVKLKVVTNEKQGGPGSWQMIDIGPRPW